MRFFFLLLIIFCSSCSSYQLGGQKPSYLKHVKRIHIPVFANQTQFPRAAVIGTHSLLDSLVEDGTYQISKLDNADAWLEATITEIRYSQARSDLNDVLRSSELQMEVRIHWKLFDTKNNRSILTRGNATGRTRFFAESNLQTARNNALPDALQRASINIVSRIADGF